MSGWARPLAAFTLPGRALAQRVFAGRVARLLGMDVSLARELLALAQTRRGERYVVRSAAFLLATTRLSPRLLSVGLRSKAIESFVSWLLFWSTEDPRLVLAYAGHPRSLRSRSCPELIPS
jgi:hypothetical protein